MDLDLTDWTDEELIAVLGLKAVPRVEPEPADRLGASSFFMAGPLTTQILGYQRVLLRTFHRAIRELAEVAADPAVNRVGGYQEGDARGEAILTGAITSFLEAASSRFPKAFDIGQNTAVAFTGRSRLVESQIEEMLTARLRKNETFVRDSLFTDVRDEFQRVLRDATLPPREKVARKQTDPDETAESAIRSLGETHEARVGMYALVLWGLGHLGFAREMEADQRLLDWVLTSLNPCVDCPELARRGPYGPGLVNPLPTVPGAGDTECWVDPRVKVFTDRGWERIDRVQIGDRVLTHAGRFMAVTDRPVDGKRYDGDVIEVTIETDDPRHRRHRIPITLRTTTFHPFMVNGEWKRADIVCVGDQLSMISKLCERCRIPMQMRRRDSRRRYCSPGCRNAVVGPVTIAKARSAIRPGFSIGNVVRGRSWEEIYGPERAAVIRKKRKLMGTSRRGKRYEELMLPEVAAIAKEKIGSIRRGKTLVELIGPERANRQRERCRQELLKRGPTKMAMARRGEPSKLEETMKVLLDRIGIRYEWHAIVEDCEVDFLLPAQGVAIECDGEYYHKWPDGTPGDARKTQKLEAAGFTVLRFWGREIERHGRDVTDRILRVVANHDGRYVMTKTTVLAVRRVPLGRGRAARRLYDLTVAEDHSYIVNAGVISHNCRTNCLCVLVGT